MAENKKGVLLYADLIYTFEELTDDEAGKLIKHLFRYVNDQNPEPPDKLTKLLFQPIKLQLKRDLEKWEATKGKRSDAGKASAEAKKIAKEIQQTLTKSTSVESVEQTSTKSTVNVSVNVNDNVINIIEEEEEGENFKIIVDLKTVTDLKKFIKEKFARSEEDLKIKLTTAKYLERQEAFILRNNERSYTSDNDFLNHYRNFILKNPQPEKEKSSGQKEKSSRTEQILNTHEQYLSTLQA